MRLILFLGAVGMLGSGCGDEGSSASLRVGRLVGQEARPNALTPVSELPNGSGAFGFAVADGMRITLTRLDFGGASSNASVDLTGEILELGADETAVSIDRALEIEPGAYSEVVLGFRQEYELRAKCRTENYLVYTTRSEIKRIDCRSSDCESADTSDYDYFRYEFLTKTADSPTAADDTDGEFTYASLVVEPEGNVAIAVLVDTSFLVTCYDGSSALDEESNDVLPFSGKADNAELSAFFPDTEPNFGLVKLNITVWGSTEPVPTLPTAETYMTSPDPTLLAGDTADLGRVQFTTVVFEENGDVYDAISRSPGPVGPIGEFGIQWPSSERGGDSYTLFGGTTRGFPDRQGTVTVLDRAVRGFRRLGFAAAPHPTAFENGPDCGNAAPAFDGEPVARPCLPASETVYWKRAMRPDEN